MIRLKIIAAAGLILSVLLASSAAQAVRSFAPARAHNADYCRSLHQGSACIDRQNREMGHFVMMMAGFALTKAETMACMERGKRGRFIDWTVATPCLRERVKGRRIGG